MISPNIENLLNRKVDVQDFQIQLGRKPDKMEIIIVSEQIILIKNLMDSLAQIVHQQIKWEVAQKTAELKNQKDGFFGELLNQIGIVKNCISNFDPNSVDEGFPNRHIINCR